MKFSAALLGGLTVTTLLATASCTRPVERAVATPAKVYSDYQLKHLVTFVRPHIAVATPELLSRVMGIAPLHEKFITLCPTSPVATRLVKIRINSYFDVKNTGRDARTGKPGGGVFKDVPEPPIDFQSTTYDVLLNKTVWTASDNYIAIKVILKDPDLMFPSDNAAVTTIGLPGDPSMLHCMDRIKFVEDKSDADPSDGSDTGNTKYEMTTVYVDRSLIMKQKFNIRVVAFHKDGIHVLPLIIDPGMDNEGFN